MKQLVKNIFNRFHLLGNLFISDQSVVMADIGGTKASFIRYEKGVLGDVVTYKVKDFESYNQALQKFLTEHKGAKPTMTIMATAGNVVNGKVIDAVNAKWTPSTDEVLNEFKHIKRASLVNDFVPQGMAVLTLNENQKAQVTQGVPEENGTIVVLGPGSGCGTCVITFEKGRPTPHASESGQSLVPILPVDNQEEFFKVFKQLNTKFKDYQSLSIERLVSGRGIVDIYEALLKVHGLPVPDPMLSTQQLTKMAMVLDRQKYGFDGKGGAVGYTDEEVVAYEKYKLTPLLKLAASAHDYFFTFLGAHAYNMAVTHKASGGIYLTGGVMADPDILRLMKHSPFFQAMAEKTPRNMRGYVQQIPIFVVKDRHAVMQGLKQLADNMIAEKKENSFWNKRIKPLVKYLSVLSLGMVLGAVGLQKGDQKNAHTGRANAVADAFDQVEQAPGQKEPSKDIDKQNEQNTENISLKESVQSRYLPRNKFSIYDFKMDQTWPSNAVKIGSWSGHMTVDKVKSRTR